MATTSDVTTSHHELPVHELLLVLETDRERGLPAPEARRRRATFGPNALPPVRATPAWVRLLRQMHNPLIYVLNVAGVVTILLGKYVDAGVILGVVVVNTLIGFVQESRAQAALEALRSLVRTTARVVRDGVPSEVASEDLVPGDLVLVEAGDRLPADVRLVQEHDLEVDESALTGESLPVAKDEVVLPAGTPVADRRNMGWSGTLVTSGSGAGVVVATGTDTELGEIHRLVGSARTLATPLTRKLARFSSVLTMVILALAGVTFGVGLARGADAAEMFVAAVALAVGAIPEGLPAAVTVTMAIGVARMARRRAVVRRLPAVETLGSATVICTDKTGTLTENRMTVTELWLPRGALVETPAATEGAPGVELPADLWWTLVAGAAANDARPGTDGEPIGDPTEAAMLRAATAFGVSIDHLTRLDTLPFSSERQLMATRHRDRRTGEEWVLVKGAVERVVDHCTTQLASDGTRLALDRPAVLAANEHLGAEGLRVLATAVGRPGAGGVEDLVGADLALAGLQAMGDPPRKTATQAVASCRRAGIHVTMITGDHPVTARAVAHRVGLLDPSERDGVISGRDLEEISADDLPAVAEDAVVFARVTPEQKLRLVLALQSRQHVVAMTGDGVNDAPALRQADIGVAMGRGGTEVAKEAGDVVLTDDDFATIEAAVEEGRGVFDNLVKFIVWTLPTNTGEALVIMYAVLLGTALPILPTQILWINMTTAVLLGLTLAWEPKEAGIMDRPPRDPGRSLLTGPVLTRTVLVSVLLVLGSVWVFDTELARGASLEAARTAAMNVFVAVEAFYLFSCRSLTGPSWRAGLLSNRVLLAGVALQALCQAAITYLPAMNAVFHTAPLGWEAWGRILLVGVIASLVASADKHRVGRRMLT